MSSIALTGLIAALIAAAVLLPMRRGRIDVPEAARLVHAGAVLIDVRSKAEYARGHLQGAVHVPLAACLNGSVDPSLLDRPLIVYCASGARSALAARRLRRATHRDVYDLGSMQRWRARIVRPTDTSEV